MMLAFFTFDPMSWIFMIPGLALGLYAQFKLSATYKRYSQVGSSRGISGAEAARAILDRAGLREVDVEEIGGQLTDHYDPTKRALFLSSGNYHGRSLAAVGVAAHEAGHALQHQVSYAPLQLRMMLVPVTQIASTAVYGLILLAVFFNMTQLFGLAILAFGVITLFQLITLPVEFNASRRAKEQLVRLGLIRGPEETAGVSRVLSAAALTYVAALVQSLMQLLYYVMLARHSDRD